LSPATAPVFAKYRGLKTIKRSSITNPQTKHTIFWCDRGGEAWATTNKITVTPADEDFWALLGTPNGNSAAWLVLQHGESMGATGIENIIYSDNDLTINLELGKS
jgi:hypothetical protein